MTQTPLSRDESKERIVSNVEYSLKNSSNEDKTVELLVPFNINEDSKIKTTQNYKFTKGNLVTFTLTVKANSQESFKVNFKSRKNG